MQKKQKQLSNYPVWFDGTNINEAAFCEEFLHTHKILFANNAFFTPEGRITDDLPDIRYNSDFHMLLQIVRP